MIAGLSFPGAINSQLEDAARQTLQGYLALCLGTYFVICWHLGGQTLPMKAWKLRVERASGERLEVWRAIARYILAGLSVAAIGLGYAWALLDPDRQYLHDRIAGTRVVAN